jgi:glycosyltransferase involved in cell wall biosynthesis
MEGLVDSFATIRVPSGSALVSSEDRLALPWYEWDVLRKVDEFRPDIIHIHTEFSVGAMGRRYCRNRGFPIISTCHTHYELYMKGYLPFLPERMGKKTARTWLKSIYARDDIIITPSRSIMEELKGYGIKRNFAVIPTGVDDRVFYPRLAESLAFRQRLEESRPGFGQAHLLLYIGRIGKEKNIDLLASALPEIFGKDPLARLLIVGEGPHKTELQESIQERGLADKVVWMNYQPRSMLPAIYSAADVFTFPSKTETQGLVTIEALLCGTPVVGVNEMGTAEILEGNRGGFLAEDNPADYAEKVLQLTQNPELRATKAAEGLAHAQAWTTVKACRRMETLYLSMSRTLQN